MYWIYTKNWVTLTPHQGYAELKFKQSHFLSLLMCVKLTGSVSNGVNPRERFAQVCPSVQYLVYSIS